MSQSDSTTTSSKKPRTLPQNSALHKYFELLAEKFNEAGLDMKAVLKPDVDIPWNKDSVKTFLWKPIQKYVTGKEHTADLTTGEPGKVYEVLTRHIGEKFGIHVPFPEDDTYINQLLK